MKLSEGFVKNVEPSDKNKKYFDGKGLHLEVAKQGGKWWRFKYRFYGKENRISFGVYPAVSLNEARKKLVKSKSLLSRGIDPSYYRKLMKRCAKGDTEAMSIIQILSAG